MKTTLKKGMGRGASPNGNGRAVAPPALPALLTPVTRYRQPPKPRRRLRLAGKILLWLLASAAVVGSGVGGGVYLYAHESAAALAPQSVEVRVAEKHLNVVLPNEPAIALIVGYDRRAGQRDEPARSDTIMLMRADPAARTLSVLSFPRDLVAQIRCPGNAFEGRINEAYSLCGARGTLETVKALTGLPIHYLITVNFRGFKQIVAKLGGVWIDVDRRYFNDVTGPYGYAAIDLQPGYQKLNGSEALDFVRYRHTDSDFHRNARQQLFLQSFKEAVTSSFSATKLPQIINVITGNVEIGEAGGGGPSLRTLLKYGWLAYQLPDGHFFQSRIAPERLLEDSERRLHADPTSIRTAVVQFANPTVHETQVPGAQPRQEKPPSPRRTSVLVLNGNGVPGAAALGSALLAKVGYRMRTPPAGIEANAPRMNYERTDILFDAEQKGAKAAAKKLARVVGDAEVGKLGHGPIAALSNGAMVVVVLGRTFTGELAATRRRDDPANKPAYVARNPEATLGLLRQYRSSMPFPLVYPTVLERTSLPDTSGVPVRLYEVARHKGVRLVFRTGASEYWGIQMTNWKDPPALEEPNEEVKLGRRRYQLYYSGPHLRMVVFRRGETSYWVVNTLMNSLSNRTMLAIARGLRFLPRR